MTQRREPTASDQRGTPNRVVYVCPMPEHVSIEYDHPGKCPICGMALVPVTPSELKQLQPGGKVLYYTCPMPEHSQRVTKTSPANVPMCGMTLIPVMATARRQPPEANIPSTECDRATLYTCPMAIHADVVSDQPGDCPKCGMDLVPTSTVPTRQNRRGNLAQRTSGSSREHRTH